MFWNGIDSTRFLKKPSPLIPKEDFIRTLIVRFDRAVFHTRTSSSFPAKGVDVPLIPMNTESVFVCGEAAATTAEVSSKPFIYILNVLDVESYVVAICVQVLTGIRLVVLLLILGEPFVIRTTLEFVILIP